MDLQSFGRKLQELRQKAGLTQKKLAGQIFISIDLLSKWERARQHQGRRWQPDLASLLRLVKLFARYLTPAEAQTWASAAGYNLSASQLAEIFGAVPHQLPPLSLFYIHRIELEQDILQTLSQKQVHTLVLSGMGGAGKSTLAAWLANSQAADFPDGIVWVEQQGRPDLGQAHAWIARSFDTVLGEGSLAEHAAQLRSLLHGKRCLLILDDVWASPELRHLLVCLPPSRMLITTRDAKVADILNIPFIPVSELTEAQGLALLARWVGHPIPAAELVKLLEGHALALSLSGAQLRAGMPLPDLLAALQLQQPNLSILDMVEAQDRAESVTLCFDLSYNCLSPEQQQYFTQLSCFNGKFQLEAVAAVWGITPKSAQSHLRQLVRLALLQSDNPGSYHLHPLLRIYAGQKLLKQLEELHPMWQRYAIWHIRYALYHPAVMDDVTDPAPNLDSTWPDVIGAVRWAALYSPALAAWAALLAHTERAALLTRLGPELIDAISRHTAQMANGPELAMLSELLGELHLLKHHTTASLACFNAASEQWDASEQWLAGSRCRLRAAGVHLLAQDYEAAAAAARQAQTSLEKALPVQPCHIEEARWLFYWFEMVYSPLTRWPELPEADVDRLARLGAQTRQPILEARGLHIYRLWCTAEAPRPPGALEKGRELALAAYRLWRGAGRLDRADDEISWTLYRLTGHYSERTAARFARRRSQTTPMLTQNQIQMIKEEGMRWWLAAVESERIAWLSRMLPRYLGAVNAAGSPLSPDSQEYRWVDEILNVAMLGNQGRWLAPLHPRPEGHILNGPEWFVLSGQKTLPLVGETAAQLVKHYLAQLESQPRL